MIFIGNFPRSSIFFRPFLSFPLFVLFRPDATLRELTDLVKEVNEEARAPTSRLDFCLVYPTRAGHFVFRPLGSVRSTKPGRDDDATLSRLRFQPGDYIDIAIFPY